jgi:amidase
MQTIPTLPLAFESACTLARRIRQRQVSSLDLTDHFIQRIERMDEQINAVVVRDFERARRAAQLADAQLARGERVGPLHGVPITVKESFDVAGLATTWGAPAHACNIAREDAEAVRLLKAAGAHVLGKTNLPLMLGDFQSHNEIYGATRNPWDLTRTPGGSSGGSAAALAAGFSALDCGSDIGGSLRNPAHFCGVYAHKPTFGIVPMEGHSLPGVAPAPDLAVAGPLARSADDLALALRLLVRSKPLDAEGMRLSLPAARHASLRGLRVAVWANDPVSPVEHEIEQRILRVAEQLTHAGATVCEQARPAFDASAYRHTYVALVSAVSAAVASDQQYAEHVRHAAQLAPGDDSKWSNVARALVQDHRTWLQHDRERTRLRHVWQRFFADWDILLCPIMATTAFVHDTRVPALRTLHVNGVEQPYFQQVFWSSLATLAYLPATVLPAGLSKTGLPIGLQAIGAAYSDFSTIEFARLVGEAIGGFAPPPSLHSA